MAAYYNEIDQFAAAWIKELIKDGLIADGEIDNRSIEDIAPSDLDGFTQCHFFAGIGVWSYALRQAGWPDDRPVWTGSCPCQPFSQAGKGGGFVDERHLWPAFHWLIAQCSPVTVFGEQVASKDGLAWLDLVCTDMEGEGYTIVAVDTCAAGFGAPHIRQRLYWMADATNEGFSIRRGGQDKPPRQVEQPERLCVDAWMADACGAGLEGRNQGSVGRQCQAAERGSCAVRMADSECIEKYKEQCRSAEDEGRRSANESCGCRVADSSKHPNPTNCFWRDADWLLCRDGKWRPTQSEIFPLAHGATNRVGILRGAGNAIVAPQAIEIIKACRSLIDGNSQR